MKKIAVIIITYRRPDGLLRLLTALANQKCLEGKNAPLLTAIVVDNDKQPSAFPVFEHFIALQHLPVSYIHESRQGIPIARNTGIDSVPKDFDFFCFIDDDEWPSDTWIGALLDTQSINNADCVLGAVIPVYPEDAPKWIVKSHIFDSWRFKNNARLKEAASNNVLISNSFISEHKHRFDERMRMTGGSDYLFFKQANSLGMKIYWSDNAAVFEEVPASRMTLKWVIKRQFRLGNTFAVSERLTGTKLSLFVLAIKGLLRMLLGLVVFPCILLSFSIGIRGVAHILRGAGIFIGTFGHFHQEYSTKNLLKDRTAK